MHEKIINFPDLFWQCNRQSSLRKFVCFAFRLERSIFLSNGWSLSTQQFYLSLIERVSGFSQFSTVVINGTVCHVNDWSYNTISCTTSASTAGSYPVQVITGEILFESSSTFEYTTVGVGMITGLSDTELNILGGGDYTAIFIFHIIVFVKVGVWFRPHVLKD